MNIECPFCEINPEKTEVLEDSNFYFVALSNPSLVPGHLLVIPKRHVELPWELHPEEKVALYDTVLRYQQIITRNFTSGCDVRQNYRPFLPQGRLKVNHVHFHLMPRELNDAYFKASQGTENSLWQDLTPEYKQKFRALYVG